MGGIDATLTGVYPYAGLTLTDRLSVWTAAGYGAGEVTVTPEGQEALTADLTMTMGAAGIRSELLTPAEDGGLALAVKGDGRFTRTSSGSASGTGGRLEASDADAWLLHTGVEGARRFALGGGDGATLTPSFELGLRLDGGDADTGFGADLGGGLAFADPKHGLSLEFRARGLLAHESSGFREWGASAGLAWDPRPGTDRGLSLSLRQGWGLSPAGGMDALLGRETLAGLAANDNAKPANGSINRYWTVAVALPGDSLPSLGPLVDLPEQVCRPRQLGRRHRSSQHRQGLGTRFVLIGIESFARFLDDVCPQPAVWSGPAASLSRYIFIADHEAYRSFNRFDQPFRPGCLGSRLRRGVGCAPVVMWWDAAARILWFF